MARIDINLKQESKDKFFKLCKSRAQTMSAVLQIVIEMINAGEIAIEEKKDNGDIAFTNTNN